MLTSAGAHQHHAAHYPGYRPAIASAPAAAVPITDNELYLPSDRRHNPRYVEQLTAFVRGADVLITDTTYRDGEYPSKVDWGHSCVSQVVKLAARADVKRLHLFHHDIDQTDEVIDHGNLGADAVIAHQLADVGGGVRRDSIRSSIKRQG
jgi:hypothetical protein